MNKKEQQAKNSGPVDVLKNAEMRPKPPESGTGRFLDIFAAMFCSGDDGDATQEIKAASRGDDGTLSAVRN